MSVIPIRSAHQLRGPAAAAAPSRVSRESRSGLWAAVALVAVVAGLVGLVAALRHERVPRLPAYRTEAVVRGPIYGVLRVPAWLEATSSVRIGAPSPGQVTEVRAQVGDRVVRGQVLARLDDSEQRATLANAETQLSLMELRSTVAEKRLLELLGALQAAGERLDDLEPDEVLQGEAGDAQLLLLQALARVPEQETARALAQKLLARRVIRAPIAGVVLARSIEAGETIAASPPGPPLFVVGADPRHLRLSVELEGRDAARVRPGPADFSVSLRPGRSFAAAIRGVSVVQAGDFSGAEGGRYLVTLDVENADGALAVGMEAIVALPMSTPDGALHVRATSLDTTAATGPAVWMLDGATRPVRVPVEAGVSDGRFVEVRAPAIVPGARVVAGRLP